MKKNLFLLTLLLITLSSSLAAQGLTSSSDEAYFRQQNQRLASDEFAGRKPLTPYEDLTINYIAEEFQRLGLQPANGDSYFQDVPLLDVTTRAKGGKISASTPKGKITLRDLDDVVLWSPQTQDRVNLKNLEWVFAGFGINAPEYDWNDYEGLDARGKIVVVLVNDPGYYDDSLFQGKNMTYYGRWIYKFEEAARQHAAGVLVVHDTAPASYGWNVVQASWSQNKEELISDAGNADDVLFKGWITMDKAEEIFQAAGYTHDELRTRALQKGFRSIALGARTSATLLNEFKSGISHNVAAILPGTDLADEYLIYSAHWDHFGIGTPVDGDSIYNGASDNASGVAALLTIARRYTQLQPRPRRSILFLSVTAEEAVLLGSQWYGEHPLVPLAKTAANINFDGVAPRPLTYDVILGAPGDSDLDRYVYLAAAAQGRHVVPAPPSTSGGYFRSDHFSFARVGIPVVLASSGRELVNPNAVRRDRGHYHQPSDEYSPDWDVSGSLQDIYLNLAIGLAIANADNLPQWSPNAAFQRKE